jgi:hypothetical protein
MRPRTPLHPALPLLVFLFVLALARPARPQTAQSDQAWFTADEAHLEERFADGDIDEEDLARVVTSPVGLGMGKERSGASTLLAESWVSLVGLSHQLPSGTNDVAGFVVVGLALDKIGQGRTHLGVRPSFADDASPRAAPPPAPSAAPVVRLTIDATLARSAVRTAWRVSGIEVNDARIDQMISRSRLSVLLPETRIRVMQMLQDGQHTTSYVNESGTIVDTSGSTTTLEARLTWRFDRLIFAGDEPTLERVRLEREEARNRIGGRVLELLFTWQRALLDEAASDAGSRAETEAALRRFEAEVSLDVLTGGWFAAQPQVRARRAPVAR